MLNNPGHIFDIQQLMPQQIQEEFDVYYQPILETETLTIVGAEALLRVNNKSGKVDVSPFLLQAQCDDSIESIDCWVLEQSIGTLNHWNDDQKQSMIMYVNIAENTLSAPEFPDVVRTLLKHNMVYADNLVLEVSLGCFYNTACVSNMKELRRLGVSIALDNIGQHGGRASVFPGGTFDLFKLDKNLFRGCSAKAGLETSLEAFTHFATHQVAVGVENKEDLALCRDLNIKYFQGFFAAQPLPASDFESWFPSQAN